MGDRELVIYEFSRTKIERGDFSHFLGAYGLDRLPTGRRLRTMMDSMVFVVDGWNHDPREVYEIPEVRRFYRQFQAAWPYWFFFCNLDQDGLKPMVYCCLENLVAVQKEKDRENIVTHPPKMEFVQFVAANLGTMNTICERAKLFDRFIYDRSKAVFEYFGLPYEAKRPE